MALRLLLRLQSDGDLSWLTQAEDGRALSGSTQGVPSPQTLAAARQIIVLVPSAQILLTETTAVTRQRNQLVRAVPYALEDQLASPVEELHFAIPERVSSAQIGVAVVARKVVTGWIEQLAGYGIRADALVPDALALPAGCIMIEHTQALLRLSAQRALVCEAEQLPEWLPLLTISESAPVSFEVFDFRATSSATPSDLVAAYHPQQKDPLRLFAQSVGTSVLLNLLQGEFVARHRQAPAQKLWRLVAMLSAAVVVLALAQALIEQWRLHRESAALEEAQRQVLNESFPAMTRDDDPPSLMKSELERLRGGAETGGLLRLLSQSAPILGSTTRIVTKSLEYRNSTLEIAVRAPDVPMLDSLRERLATVPGLKVEVTAANPNEAGVDGRLRVSGGKP